MSDITTKIYVLRDGEGSLHSRNPSPIETRNYMVFKIAHVFDKPVSGTVGQYRHDGSPCSGGFIVRDIDFIASHVYRVKDLIMLWNALRDGPRKWHRFHEKETQLNAK